MSGIKGITSWTSVSKRLKHKSRKTPQEICKSCKYKNICLYKDLTRMDEKKMFDNNVECEHFNFVIEHRAQLTYEYDKLNKKIKRYSFSGKTEEEALNKARAQKVELDKNGGPRILNVNGKTLADYINDYINEKVALGKIKDNTLDRNKMTLIQLKKYKFINKSIADVTRNDLLNYFSQINKYSETTIKQQVELIKHSFDKAFYEKVIPENFFIGYNCLEKPKSHYVSKRKRISLTIEEEKKLVDYLWHTPYYQCKNKYVILLQLSIGLRIGEALSLTIDDIDFEKNILHIHKTLTKIKGKFAIGEVTKTANGMRDIPMNKYLQKILKEAVDHMRANKKNLLFCGPTGDILNEQSINSALKRICIHLGIGIYQTPNKKDKMTTYTDVHTHMLRATFATRCAEAKMAPKVLAKILGHSDPKITNKYYVSISDEFVQSENVEMESYMDKNNIFSLEEKITNDET